MLFIVNYLSLIYATRDALMPLIAIKNIKIDGDNSTFTLDTNEKCTAELPADPVTAPLAFQVDADALVVGFLVRDEDAENPLTNCDGLGAIYSTHRDAGRDQHQAFFSALGLDAYGDPDADLSVNPYAVALDCYQHGGNVWAPSGSAQARNFPDQQFDVSHGVGVWVPDEAAKEECDRRADVYAFFAINKENKRVDNESVNLYHLLDSDNALIGTFPQWHEAFASAQNKVQDFMSKGIDPQIGKAKAGKELAKAELAGEACDALNQWSTGESFGVVICTFSRAENTNFFSSAEVWESSDAHEGYGYLGCDYAVNALAEQFALVCDNLTAEHGSSPGQR